MNYVNHVYLQGYLEILSAQTVQVNGQEVPVLHGLLHTGEFLSTHKLLITNAPAAYVLEMIRDIQDNPPVHQAALLIEEGQISILPLMKDKPLVVVEGRLISKPKQESVVDVKWITFLSVPTPFERQEERRWSG
ncbi:MAG: hypothetical protein ANABAC_1319 [Anaerolineae bacterium]|nr:MAG: hypothetical protein ANABAC_1319 [Anaerolineae bacterium]